MHTLHYDKESNFWEEALPLGNGHIGAMVFGGTTRERIQLSEDTLWSGRPSDEDGYAVDEHLETVRQLLRDGRYSDATELTDTMMGKHDSQCYQMAGDLFLDFDAEGDISNYRQVNFVGIVTIAPELIIFCPPVLVPGQHDRLPFFDIFVMDHVGTGSGLKPPLVAVNVVFSKLLVEMLRCRA